MSFLTCPLPAQMAKYKEMMNHFPSVSNRFLMQNLLCESELNLHENELSYENGYCRWFHCLF